MTDHDAADLLAANRRRRAVRRWFLIAGLPVAIVALLVAGKLLSMYAFAHTAFVSYAAGDYDGTIAAARGQQPVNLFEPYLAPYNEGTGLAAAGRLPEARDALRGSLGLARGLEQCPVRANLSLVLERLGDAARESGEEERATRLYDEGLAVSRETPEECPDNGRDERESRMEQKQQPPEEPEEQQSQPEPSKDQLDEVEEKLKQGAEEREQRDGEGSPGEQADQPW